MIIAEGETRHTPGLNTVVPRHILGLTAIIIVAYAGSILAGSSLPSSLSLYVIQPALWGLPVFVLLRFNRTAMREAVASTREVDDLVALGFLLALIQIGGLLLAGLVFGFGRSPYSQGVVTGLANLWFVASILIAREILRTFLVRYWSPHGEMSAILGTWVVFFCTALPFAGYSLLSEANTAFPHIGGVILPMAAAQLLATYLSLRSGALASIAFMGTLTIFEWFAPILPDLPWTVTAMIAVLVPVIGVSILESSSAVSDRLSDGETEELSVGWPWIAAPIVGLLLIWFNIGIFGVQPSVVHGVSMQPSMHTGDIVITRDVNPDDLVIGDIIRFKQHGLIVLHRIVDIDVVDGERVFTAQGDNNSNPDGPVAAKDVHGRMVTHIPKAGLPAVYVRYAFNWVLK